MPRRFSIKSNKKIPKPEPVVHIQHTADSEHVETSHLFPHVVKYFAWFIVSACVVVTSTVLILYGVSFGKIKNFLWLVGIMTTFLLTVVIAPPVQILISALVRSICMKRNLVIVRRKINPALLINHIDVQKKRRILTTRQVNMCLYKPTPSYKLQDRLDDIKYNIELQHLITDILVYGTLLSCGIYIVMYNKPPMAFYSNDIISGAILNGSSVDSVYFRYVKTYDMLFEYLNKTLLPILLQNSLAKSSLQGAQGKWMRRKGSVSFKSMTASGASRRRGWTLNPNVKLLGKARFRQVRVKTGTCKHMTHFSTAIDYCHAELNMFNVERGDFSVGWGPPETSPDSDSAPWKYQSAYDSGTVPIMAKFASYPAGGYIIELAKHINDSRIILQYMKAFRWLDERTRAFFVDFTLYCANTNSFTVVTLIAERTATGHYITSYQIDTCKFLFTRTEFWVSSVIVSGLFCLLMFFYLFREGLRIHRISFKMYLARGSSVIDLVAICLAVGTMIFIVLRSSYVSSLIKKLEKAKNNEFVGFICASCLYQWSLFFEALLVCFSVFKLIRLLALRTIFFKIQHTLARCYACLFDLLLMKGLLITAFSFFFNLTLVNHAEDFCSLEKCLANLLGKTALGESFTSMVMDSSWYLLHMPVFLCLFVALCLLFINFFIAVVCLYFRKIRDVQLINKYHVFAYIKHCLTLRRQKDLLLLEDVKPKHGKMDLDVMRLKGGGNKVPKCRKKERFEAVALRHFVTRKIHDATEYVELPLDREKTMRNIILMYLSDDERERSVFSENSLKALYCSLTMDKRLFEPKPPNYYMVVEKCKKEIFEKSSFWEMRKLVEEYGIEKELVRNLDMWAEQETEPDHRLDILQRQLSILMRKQLQKKGSH